MNKNSKMKKVLLTLLSVALLLCGCDKENPDAPKESQQWAQTDLMTYGVMESEKLTVLPWHSGRLEYATGNNMAETEKGYYMVYGGRLIYADKTDLSNWIPVCSKPACDHSTNSLNCDAGAVSDKFYINDGRIHREAYRTADLAPGRGGYKVLVSTALNGTDMRLEYDLKEAAITSSGTFSSLLFPDYWVYSMDELDQYGKTRNLCFYVSDQTVETLADFTSESGYAGAFCARDWYRLLGDRYFYCTILSQDICRFHNGKLEKFDLSLVPDSGGCIMGSTLRSFQRNKGYYDTDVSTGKKTKIGDNQLRNSDAVILLPNCIIETTLLWDSLGNRKDNMTHTLLVFDGENWRNVDLPSELLHADENSYIDITGVSSDSIFFMLRNEKTYASRQELSVLYRIPLDAEALTAEYCSDILGIGAIK